MPELKFRTVGASLLSILCLASTALSENANYRVHKNSIGETIALETVGVSRSAGKAKLSASEALALGLSFVDSKRAEFRIPEGSEFQTQPVTQDNLGHSRVRMMQEYQGVSVWGKEAIVNLNPAGEVIFASADISNKLPVSVTPTLKKAAAQSAALKLARAEAKKTEKLKVSDSELIILPSNSEHSSDTDKLVWRVVVDTPVETGFSKTYFIDAQDGTLAGGFENKHKLHRIIFDCSVHPNDPACYYDEEGISPYMHGRSEGKPVRGPHNNPSFSQFGSTDVDRTYDLASILHNWIQTSFGINGANNQGGMRSTAGQYYQSRYLVHSEGWNGNQDSACPGSAYLTPAYTVVMCHNEVLDDVISHEVGHAISHWCFTTGGGAPMGVDSNNAQSRALSESHSDVMGEGFEYSRTGFADWMAGGETHNAPWRDLINPHEFVGDYGERYAQRFYDQYFNCSSDVNTDGYYLNSTVYSHAMYLASEGGEMNGCTIEGQGIEFVKQIYHRAYRNYFARSQGFNTAYTKLLQACADLYTPLQCAELQKALQAVEADQLGICFDPEGASGEDAPACAVNNVGTVSGAWPTGNYATYFAPGETVAVSGSGGIAGKEVDVYLLPTSPTRPVWAEMNGSIAQTSATVDEYGNSLATLGAVSTPGVYDILVDGNQDGNYQPWADSIATITVAIPVNGDGTCYIGQSYGFSENCHDDGLDCGCSSGYICQGSGAPTQYSCVPRPRGTCFLKGAKITMFDGTEKLIEDIKVDDQVLSFDVDKGEYVVGTVENLIRDETKEYVILNGKTKVTPNHRFYVPKNSGLMNVSLSSKLGSSERALGDWIEIGKLSPGAMLLGSDGKLIEVKSIERVKESAPVYNFEVSPNHNYVANGVVVHNRKKLPYQDGYGGQELP